MLLRAASLVTTLALVAGLLWWVVEPDAASLLLSAGLLVLMATPIFQLIGAVAEEVRAREWGFALAGAGVLLLLGVSAVVALLR